MNFFWPDNFYNEFKFYSNIKLKLPMDFKRSLSKYVFITNGLIYTKFVTLN